MSKFAFFDENRHLEVRIFDLKICSAIFAPHVFPVFFSNPSNSKGFELQWFGKIYIPHDIAPFLTVWGAEINVELALILETENLENFQNCTRVRRNTHVQQWAWVVCAYCAIGFPEPRFQ